MSIAANAKAEFLSAEHPIYTATLDRWTENERRLRGGDYILDELRRFKWETLPGQTLIRTDDSNQVQLIAGEHYLARQKEASYINFPEMLMLGLKGHLFRKRPLPGAGLNFGTLGDVRSQRDVGNPTFAELIYYNADGVGNDGSQWDNVWLDAWCRAGATGHRWMFIEAPSVPAQTAADVIAGARPFIVEFSPQQVPHWHFDKGKLRWAWARVATASPKVNGAKGTLDNSDAEDGYLLMTAQGVDDLGPDFIAGGWWLFDSDKKFIGQTGTWDATNGEIPFFPLYQERDKGVAGRKPQPATGNVESAADLLRRTKFARQAMSKAATTELGQLAVAYMNLSSAADYDAWDAASSLIFLLGVDKDAYNIAASVWAEGGQIVPVPGNEKGVAPTIADGSAGAVSSEVFNTLLTRKYAEAERLALQFITSSPDSSGLSKEAGFADQKSPRLASIASELETAQNIGIRFLEQRMRLGTVPTGSTAWTRDFKIVDVVNDVKDIFELQQTAGVSSKTLTSKSLVRAAKERNLIEDEAMETKVLGELEESADAAAANAAALRTLNTDLNGGGGGPTPPLA